MGIYEKTGLRNLAISFFDLVTWTRYYGLKNALSILHGLAKKKPLNDVNASMFKNPVWLRDNYSDKAIFKQVFYEKQYNLDPFLPFSANRIIDAGANIGFASLYFAALFPEAEIVAIEPELNNYELLRKNTTGYPKIRCEHAALWNRNEMVSISNPDSLAASFMVEKSNEDAIRGITIDSILQQQKWDSVDIVKIDIEGAEKEVFSSDNSWLPKVKMLIIELHDRYKPGCTKTFFKALENLNYEAFFQHENIFILIK